MEKKNPGKKSSANTVNNTIEINPKLDDNASSLKEAASGTVVLGWGRMNPITTGHEKLINKIKQVAQDERAVAQVYLTQSEDPKKNPLSYNDKIKLAQKAFGNMIVKTKAKTIIQVMQELQKKFKEVILVVGSDRVQQFDTLLNKYNGKDFTFDNIDVVSAGERDPDADDVSGMSASKMRELAKDNNLAKFKQGLPKGLKSSASAVFDMVRAGMQLAEELEAENVLIEAVLTQQQRRKRAMIMRKYKTKIAAARKRAMRRAATMDKLKTRARKKAINIIRKKVAGSKGLNYAELSPGEKMIIDKKVEKRKAAIDRIAKRMIPQVRRADLMRLSGKKVSEDFDMEFENFMEETQASNTLKPRYHEARKKDGTMKFDGRFRPFKKKEPVDEDVERTKATHKREKEQLKQQHKDEMIDAKMRELRMKSLEDWVETDKEILEWIDVLSTEMFETIENDENKLVEALAKKADKAGVDYDTIELVYNLGMHEWREGESNTPQQLGFATVNRFITSEDKHAMLEALTEGVNDPGIFKAVFLAGGPGSGKSFIVGKTALTTFGLKLINSDDAFEAQLKKAGLSTTPEDIFSDKGQEIRGRAKALTKTKQKLALDGRLGLVIDGTGKDYDKIAKQAAMLRGMGYDTAMIFVNTDLDTAQARNEKRDRTLPAAVVEKMWKDVQKNIGKFQNFFGRHMYIVDNSEGANWEGAVNSAYKRIGAWVKEGPSNPTAKGWITQAKALRGIKEEVELDEAKRPITKDAVVKILIKRGNNPKVAKDMVEKEFASAVKRHPQATAAKIAEIIRVVAEEVDLDEAFENFTQGTEIDENWAVKKVNKVLFKGKYAKAAQALKALIDRKAKEAGGLKKMKHSPEYYAARVLQTTAGGQYLDARELAKMVGEEYQIDEKIAHELDPKKTLKHAMKDAIAAKDRDMDGDVDELDKPGVATPDEITGAEKENLTKKYFANRKKEAQHTKVGVAYEAYGDMDRGTPSLTKKYVKDTPYQVIPNGVTKQKDGTYTESDELFVTTNRKKPKSFREMNEGVTTTTGDTHTPHRTWTAPKPHEEHDEVHTQQQAPHGAYPDHVHKMLNHLADKDNYHSAMNKAKTITVNKMNVKKMSNTDASSSKPVQLDKEKDTRVRKQFASGKPMQKPIVLHDTHTGHMHLLAGNTRLTHNTHGNHPGAGKTPVHAIQYDSSKHREMNEEVSQKQIKDLEVFADRLLNKFDIDIEFTRHFADRMNDSRNNPEIKIAELQQLFKKIAKQKGTNIKQNADAEVVLKDIQKDLNLPVVIKYRKDTDEFEVVNKTIMRKKNFTTPNKTIEYK